MNREFTFTVSGSVPEAVERAARFWKGKHMYADQYVIKRQTGDSIEIKHKGDRVREFTFTMAFAPASEGKVTVRVITEAEAAQLGDLGWELDQWCKLEGIPPQHINRVGAKDILRKLGCFCACGGIVIGIIVIVGLLSRL